MIYKLIKKTKFSPQINHKYYICYKILSVPFAYIWSNKIIKLYKY